MSAPATTGVNEDLLRRVLTYITEHPDEHDQGNWAVRTECGTAYCLAGHTVVLSGHEVDWPTAFGASATTVTTAGVAGTDQTIGELAATLLGLDFEDAAGEDGLFWGGHELRDLWRIAAELTDGRVSRPVATTPTK